MAKTLLELGAPLELHSNPCGRGAHGTPLELARGGGHSRIASMIEETMRSKGGTREGVVPQKIFITGTRPYGGAYNDEWNRVDDQNGKPRWARRGNPGCDFIHWDGRRWCLRYTGFDRPGYVHDSNTPLPPKNGWRHEKESGGVPRLRFEHGASPAAGALAAGGGTIEFLGLWKDTGDRAMPIKMNVSPGDPHQIRRAFDTLIGEMRSSGVSSGVFAAQSYNQMHWSANPNEQGYKKHGCIGFRPEQASRSSWSGREHRREGMRIDGFDGAIDILGGDWQNAVYKVTLGGGGGGSSVASSAAAPPQTVKVSGAGIWWCNDSWNLAGTKDGRPYWRRSGNPGDCLAYMPAKGSWTLSGTPGAGDSDVYIAAGDTPLPPKHGWQPRSGGGSFGSQVPTPAPQLDYVGGSKSAAAGGGQLDGHYFSFKTGGDPRDVVDRFEARQVGDRVTYYRNGPVGSKSRVNSASANPMESYHIDGDSLHGPVNATIKPNGDIEYSHGYTSRKEDGGGHDDGHGGGGVAPNDLDFFLLRNADFTGRDERTTTEACGSVEEAARLLASKPRESSTCYAWRHESKLVSIPAVGAEEMGNGAKWVSGAELLVCGKDTGHQSKGKLLIALENVDCCFGDGQVFGGVSSYDAALRMVVTKDNVEQTAYFYHSSSSRLIEKPKNRGANWVGYPGYGWLFLWADERIGSSRGGGGGEKPSGFLERVGNWFGDQSAQAIGSLVKLPIKAARASSEHSGGYQASNVFNGRMGQDGGADWSTKGEGAGAWIELTLGEPATVSLLKFAGRVRDDKFRQVRLSFSDGSEQHLELKNNAALNEYPLQPTTTSFVEVLKRELGVEGNVKAVIDQAVEQLGVSAEGKSLSALGAACMEALGH